MTIDPKTIAVLVATAAGTAAVLALAAAAAAWTNYGAAVLLGLTAIWVVQPVYVLTRRRAKEHR